MPTTPTASGPIVEYQDTPLSNGQELPVFNQFLPIREVTTNDEINAYNLYRPFNLLETVFNMEPQGSFDNIFRSMFTVTAAARNNQRTVFGMGANFNNSNNIIQNPVANAFDINIARGNISALASHFGVSIPASLNQQVTTNSTVRAQDWNDVILTARDCWNHRFDGWKTATVMDGPTVSMSEVSAAPVLDFGDSHAISFRYNFSSVKNMLRFFTVGGAIGYQFVSPQTPTARANLWSNMFDIAGTVRLSTFQVDANIDVSFLDPYNLSGTYSTQIFTITNPYGTYSNNTIFSPNQFFYIVRWLPPSGRRFRIINEISVFIENGYSCIVLEPRFTMYNGGGVSRNVTAKVWQPNATLASFLPNFENPTVTASPHFLQHTPLSFRQP